MIKKTWIFAIILMLAACSSEPKSTDTKEEPAPKTAETSPTEKNEEVKEEPVNEEVTSIEEEGTYIGLIDNNSIEVEAAGETLVLRLTDEVRDDVESLEEGAKVNIIYKKNEEGQWLLEQITEKSVPEAAPSKKLTYIVDGTSIEEDAVLTESELNYHFYKLPDFEFTAEEPRKDLLFATKFAETFVRIEPLSEESSIDDLKEWANDELKAVGEVSEVNGKEIAGPAFENTALFITASKDSYKKYIVIQDLSNGDQVKYTVNLPEHKNAAKWEQAIWAMLSTIQTK
ncbi:hypothetical protein IHV10_04110 [Fictibacillus sp. 5RED26]|jgi:hypothetical protein|uniref:hypothetical protein n=1 Tax=Fictibacillus sp. 5RED26 TaxID=2745876 RepID=UPI0018CCFE9A|nr:hypothetical protein [Fictibacillus sp. 5RED26]MBH0155538.1 hypothetical protein [Fictibacillus sp. 5RED26]